VPLALQHRQAVEVRPDAPREQRVAAEQQMVSRDRRRDARRRRAHELDRFARGGVLQHHAQPREAGNQRRQDLLDEHALPVEHVDFRVGDFAVHQERHAVLLHGFQRAVAAGDVGHTGVGMRGGSGRVVLDRVHRAARARRGDFLGRRTVGEVQRHQRLEARPCRQRREDAVAVCERQLRRRDRRLEVGHDDGAGEAARRVGEHGAEVRAVAQMQMPVVGTGDCYGSHLHRHSTGNGVNRES